MRMAPEQINPSPPSTVTAKPTHDGASDPVDTRRSILTALLGGIGMTALAGCSSKAEDGPASLDRTRSAVEAISGMSNIYWADSVASLRSLAGAADYIAILECYATPGDGGGGLFVWTTGSQVDNGGTILNANGCGGAAAASWSRVYSGALNVRWFGAVGDGCANDTTALTRTISAAVTSGGNSVLIPHGSYKVTSAISLSTQGLRILGENYVSTRILVAFSNTSAAVFALSANCITVSQLTIAPASSSYNSLWCGFSFASVSACVIDNCFINYPYTGMFLASGESDWLDICVSIGPCSYAAIDFWGGGTTFTNNSRIRIMGEVTGPGQGLTGDSYGIRLGGQTCTVEGGEIALCKWPLQLAQGHTVKDVFIEAVDNGVWVTGAGNVVIGGQIQNYAPRIDPGGTMSYVGLDSTGTPSSDIQLLGTVSGELSGLRPIMASYRMGSNQTLTAGQTVTIDFNLSEWDTNGAVITGSSWSFKCPAAGVYRISATLHVSWGSSAGNILIQASRTGAVLKSLGVYGPAGWTNGSTFLVEIACAANDTLSLLVWNDTSSTITVNPAWAPCWVHIEKIQGS